MNKLTPYPCPPQGGLRAFTANDTWLRQFKMERSLSGASHAFLFTSFRFRLGCPLHSIFIFKEMGPPPEVTPLMLELPGSKQRSSPPLNLKELKNTEESDRTLRIV